MKNSIFNAVCKTRYLALLVVLIFTCGNALGALTYTYTKMTSATSLDTSADYVIGNVDGYGCPSSNNGTGITTTEANWVHWKAVNGTNGFYLYNGSVYIKVPTSNAWGSGTSSDKTLLTTDANGILKGKNSNNETRYLKKNTSNAYLRWYTSGQTAAYLYKVTGGSVAVTGVTLNKTSTSIAESYKETLTATVAPSDASDKSVTWSSNNTSVATVADGVVTAVAPGNATITVTTTDGGKTATCAVTVTALCGSYSKATYTVTSSSAVSASGAPTGADATFVNTYSTKDQMTSGKSQTLTLSGYTGCVIKGLTLTMRSNGSAGAGTLSVKVGSTSIAAISSATNFNAWGDNTSYGTDYRDVHITLSNDNLTVGSGKNIVIVISATTNSLYCTAFKLCYEEGCAAPTSVGTKNGSISKTGFTATWTAPSSAPANGYYVAYSTSSTTPGDITASSGDYTVVSVGAGTTEKAISSLTDGGLYYFWVRSRCSASDNSGWSDRASVQLSKINLSQTSLTGMTYVYNGASGGPSSQTKSFTVTGTNVGGNLTVSAPTNFQVSTDNSSWGSSKTITATSGSASGTVYVRLAGGLNAGSYGSASTYVTVSDGGSKASSKNVSVQGSVTKATLNPSFGSAIYNITRDVSTSTSFTLTNVPSDYTGDITYQRTNSPTYSSYLTVDGSEKTFTASRSGSWTVTAQFAADANYNAKASGVTCTVNAVMHDTYVDNVNGQSVTEAQRTDDGVNPYTSPSLSDVAAGSACKGTKTHLIGWATATFIANVGNGTLTGADSDYTQANGFYAVGETLPAASGATYYAVYGEEE